MEDGVLRAVLELDDLRILRTISKYVDYQSIDAKKKRKRLKKIIKEVEAKYDKEYTFDG